MIPEKKNLQKTASLANHCIIEIGCRERRVHAESSMICRDFRDRRTGSE